MDMIGQRSSLVASRWRRRRWRSRRSSSRTRKIQRREDVRHAGDTPALTDVPQLRALYEEAEGRLTRVKNRRDCSLDSVSAPADRIPPADLTRAIAVAKIRAVETAIELCFRLKQEVGSYALMDAPGFSTATFSSAASLPGRLANPSQKLARDAFTQWNRTGGKPPSDWSRAEVQACGNVAAAVETRRRGAELVAGTRRGGTSTRRRCRCERVVDQDAKRSKL